MTPEELQKRQHRAEHEPLVIARQGDAYRVHSPGSQGSPYLVRGVPDQPICTCPDFEHHAADPDWRCKHVLAVLGRLNGKRVPGNAKSDGNGVAMNGHSQMLLKRSISPDGRIDSLSVEFSYPLNGGPAEDVEDEADRILRLQNRIVARFLNGNGQTKPRPQPQAQTPAAPENGKAVPAELVGIRGTDGKWGRRLFITVRADDRYLRLYGSRKQLAEHLTRAGYPDRAGDVREDVQLGLPCRIVTRPVGDNDFLKIEEVLPPASGRSRGN